ncbi:hypothetical protein BCON_0095g00030 [Botryotinia convoluta]|uniref:DUF7918 domain-containing protein n=1 Tax=Botryotinia convoluta TaxID=54673 RepID=A0A4Z1I0S4_9HELO|nr:hypothetical protein BCON_0095g00030 [Botryotinia convoluta]
MAIMSGMAGSEGEIEVRIKRHSGRYYDEYVRLNREEGSSSSDSERFIVVEPGTTYYVEVTLKAGFDFGKYDLVQAKLYMDNEEISYGEFKPPCHGSDSTKTKKDLVEQIRYANIEINGRERGSRFVLGSVEMEIDEQLSKEDDTMSILPHNIPTLQVDVSFFESVTVTLSDNEYKRAISSWERDCGKLRSGLQNSTAPEKPNRTKKYWQYGHCVEGFKFCPRPADFFENDNIAKYPPLLYLYDWKALNNEERKIAVEDLQDLEKVHWNTIKGNDLGQNLQSKGVQRKTHLKNNLPREWRAWYKMYGPERREVFDTLQERRKARERGEMQIQYRSVGGEVMSFGGEAAPGELATALPIATIPKKAPLDHLLAEKEAPAPANLHYGESRLRAVSPSPYGMRAYNMRDMGSYSSPYPRIGGLESMGVAVPLNARPLPAIESPVVIPDDSVTESTHVNVTTQHRNKTIDGLNSQVAASQASALHVKREPIDVISLDSDDEVMFVSEAKVFKAVRYSEPARATKPAAVNIDEDLQEVRDLQKLREEKENLQRDIELLEKKRKMDEITKKIEDAEARAKKIKTE